MQLNIGCGLFVAMLLNIGVNRELLLIVFGIKGC